MRNSSKSHNKAITTHFARCFKKEKKKHHTLFVDFRLWRTQDVSGLESLALPPAAALYDQMHPSSLQKPLRCLAFINLVNRLHL